MRAVAERAVAGSASPGPVAVVRTPEDVYRALEAGASACLFKDTLSKAAIGQFGSGWGWAYVSGGKLTIKGFPNQDNPISTGGAELADKLESEGYESYAKAQACLHVVRIELDGLPQLLHACLGIF